MTGEDPVDLELMLNRFKRLFGELLRGSISRQSFQPWEVDLIIDFQECQVPAKRRLEILRQWERAVTRQMQTGPGPPMKLSTFLVLREQRREKLKSAGLVAPEPDTGR
jgi:hypothetical protein